MEDLPVGNLAPVELIERDGEPPRLVGAFAIFGRWQEINNHEGHFLERISQGAFAKTITENLKSVKVLLSHGKDSSLGASVLGTINRVEEQPDGAMYDVTLFRSVPPLLVDGLRAGAYGASFRGDAIQNKVDYRPGRSSDNPEGLPQVTRTEIRLKDFGPTPYPQYADTTALMRTEDPEKYLLEVHAIERELFDQGAVVLDRDQPEASTGDEDEPQHSEPETPTVEEDRPSWLLS